MNKRIARMVYLYSVKRWSYQKIGDEFGVTRNAVSGVFNRLRACQPGPKTGWALPPADPARMPDGPKGDFYIPGPPQGSVRDHAARAYPDFGDPGHGIVKRIAFADLPDAACRFPIKGSGRELVCCGGDVMLPSAEGKRGSYCGQHVFASSRRPGREDCA